MNALTVLYDARCELCCSARHWMRGQAKFVELLFVPAGSEEARRIFPSLNHSATLTDLTVVGDDGAVYRGAKAWLICLWALRDYRAWSLKLASPEMMPTARRFIGWVSKNRFGLARYARFLKRVF